MSKVILANRKRNSATSNHVSEIFPTVGGVPLRLSLTPEAIWEHFDGYDLGLTEEQLRHVGIGVLFDDSFNAAFHDALVRHTCEIGQIDSGDLT